VTIFYSPLGDLKLARWPLVANDPLQAWDAADEYLLRHIFNEKILDAQDSLRILILNDGNGALSCALQQFRPVNWSDSINSHTASLENANNNFAESTQTLLKSSRQLRKLSALLPRHSP